MGAKALWQGTCEFIQEGRHTIRYKKNLASTCNSIQALFQGIRVLKVDRLCLLNTFVSV